MSIQSRGKRDTETVVAVDTGGTFTDLLRLREGEIQVLKVASTPSDPAEAILGGLTRLLEPGEPFTLLHGSTVATNALLERKGARVVLVTNRGIEDVLEIGRQNRPQLYALVGHRPPPLVPSERRLGLAGRVGPTGEEVEPLDEDELEALAARVSEAGAEAVAVTLLHAYADPVHERRVADRIRAALPELPVSVSSEILPEFREYERTSTTVVNAYLAPVMSRYLERLEREAGARRLRVMGSSGGAMPVRRAAREAVHTVLSGPAGGVVGALAWARAAGIERILTFDMGGTSTDVSLCPGRPLRTNELVVDGQPVAIPVIDIHTVGAGGGSIARIDPGGALRVGPESAGADPGPIVYGRGGERVTVTDAHTRLGRIDPDAFLGGSTALDPDALDDPLRRLAEEGGTDSDAMAEGILEVAEATMERALRVISVERGYDPADFTLVAFGGAGGLHAAGLADRLGARGVLIPPDPGLLSAYGILVAPVVREGTRTLLETAPSDPAKADARAAEVANALERDARDELAEEYPDRADEVTVTTEVDARYRGQSFELRIPAGEWLEGFHRAHESRYGYARRDAPVELVAVRVCASLAGATGPPPDGEGRAAAGDDPPGRPARAFWKGESIDIVRYARRDLPRGGEWTGPAAIDEYSATIWVPPGWTVRVDALGCLHLCPAR